MVRMVIKGCEFDADENKDVIWGDQFRLGLDTAIELAGAGVEFSAARRDGSMAGVAVCENEYGELILKTDPGAVAANHLGEIIAPPIVRPRYRAQAAPLILSRPAYAVAA